MFKKILSRLFICLTMVGLAACNGSSDSVATNTVNFATPPASSIITNGAVGVITKDTVRYHNIEFTGGATSTLIETASGVVIVDVGLPSVANSGSELRAYANALQKTIEVIITHNHGDHYGNLGNFSDVNVYASSNIATALMANNGFTALYSKPVIGVQQSKTLAGLEYHFASVSNAETTENGYIYIPSTKALFTGDLIYLNSHNYIREYTPKNSFDEIDSWVAGLNSMKVGFSDYSHLFVGHGGYASAVPAAINENIAYLVLAQSLIKGTATLTGGGTAATNQQVVDELKLRYPDFVSSGLLLSLPGAFGEGDPGADWF